MKRKFLKVFILSIIFINLFIVTSNASGFDIRLEGKPVNFTNEMGYPYLDNNRTMVPIRIIGESLGHSINWNKISRIITIDDNISLEIGNSKVKKLNSGEFINMDTKAVIKNNRTYIPLRFVAEALGHEIEYDRLGSIHKINIIRRSSKSTKNISNNKDLNLTVFIKNINLNKKEINLEEIEWLFPDGSDDDYDSRRLRELGIDIDDLPSGYHIEESGKVQKLKLKDNTKYAILDEFRIEIKQVDLKTFMNKSNFEYTPYNVVLNGGYVVSITECYIP